MSGARVSPRLLAALLTLAACFWTAAIFSAPLVRGAMPVAARAVNVAASFICHQRDERSFHLEGERLPVCGRCTGLYLAGAIGAVAAWVGVACAPARTRRFVVLAAVPTAVTLAIEWSGAGNPGNVLRATSALPLGGVAGWLFVRMLRVEVQPGTCAIIT